MFSKMKKAFVALFFDREDNESWTGIIIVLIVLWFLYWGVSKAYEEFFFVDYQETRIKELEKAVVDRVAERDKLLELEKAEVERKEVLRQQFFDQFYSEQSQHNKTKQQLALTKRLLEDEKYKKWVECGYPSELDAHRMQLESE